jgi:hypothetical protein
MTLNGDVRTQNAPFLLLLLLGNRDVNEQAWEFVKGEWETILERFPDNTISRLLGGITALNTPELAADVAAFLATTPSPRGPHRRAAPGAPAGQRAPAGTGGDAVAAHLG